MASTTATDLLDMLAMISGNTQPGFRPVHAKGQMYSGTFTPTAAAAKLTRAPHATRPTTPITVRFSIAAGLPTAADNDPASAGPQGMAIRFHLGPREHTDIVAHSFNGFIARTGDEFLEFLKAAVASGPGAASPPPVALFLAAHPATKAYVEAKKPIPSSYARQAYFALTAFNFINAAGEAQFGRFRIQPEAGVEHLTVEQAQQKPADFLSAEMTQRLSHGPAVFRIFVQLAAPGDEVANATIVWPESRPEVEFGVVTLNKREDEQAPELKKIIFDPLPRVDGIDSAGDPLTELRADAYLTSGRRRRGTAGVK